MVVVFAPPTSGDDVLRCSAVLYYPREVICFQWASTCNEVAESISVDDDGRMQGRRSVRRCGPLRCDWLVQLYLSCSLLSHSAFNIVYSILLHFNFVVLLVYTTTPSIQSRRLAEKFLWRHRRHCPRVAIAAKATMQRPPSAPASGRTDSDTRSVHVMANLFSSLTTETDGFHCPRGHCVARLRHGHPGVGSKQPRAHEQKPLS